PRARVRSVGRDQAEERAHTRLDAVDAIVDGLVRILVEDGRADAPFDEPRARADATTEGEPAGDGVHLEPARLRIDTRRVVRLPLAERAESVVAHRDLRGHADDGRDEATGKRDARAAVERDDEVERVTLGRWSGGRRRGRWWLGRGFFRCRS